jgi:hypothetical protein
LATGSFEACSLDACSVSGTLAGLAQRFQVGEFRARVDERLGRLLLAEAIHLHAIGQQAHHHRGEIGIAGHDGEAIQVARVQQVHGIDHHRHVRGVLALAVGELLDRADRILVQHRFPPFNRGLFQLP